MRFPHKGTGAYFSLAGKAAKVPSRGRHLENPLNVFIIFAAAYLVYIHRQ